MQKNSVWRQEGCVSGPAGLAGAVAAVVLVLSAFAPATAQENRTTYQYDGLGRLVKEARPEEGGETVYTYDALGNRLTAVEQSTIDVSFRVNDASVSEGGALNFTVTKDGSTPFSHSVSYATLNGTAGAGDYASASGTLVFAPGETTKTVTAQTTEDSIYEPAETVLLTLSSATNGATIADSQGVGTIINDDAAPSFAINNVARQEGQSLTFTVAKSSATAFTHNVSYATANGSAVAGSDYVARSGTLSFAPSEMSKTFTITSVGDSVYESNETFFVNLSNATNGATIADSQGVGTIINDDPNLPPKAGGNSVNGEVFETLTVYPLANDSDPEGHAITLTGYTASSSSVSVTWNAASGRMDIRVTIEGTHWVDYTISDGHGGTDTGRINISVTSNSSCGHPPCLPGGF